MLLSVLPNRSGKRKKKANNDSELRARARGASRSSPSRAHPCSIFDVRSQSCSLRP